MNLLTYNDMKITVLSCTENPSDVVRRALAITTMRDAHKRAAESVIAFAYKAGHGSVLEHAYMTVLIENVSRSFMSQITRHRMASFTISSQHYQNYSVYPHVVHPAVAHLPSVNNIIEIIEKSYTDMVESGVPVEEARQILPNSKAVNIMMTANARQWAWIINQRICLRNCQEMYMFAKAMYLHLMDWFPELFKVVGADCQETGKCRQGHMSCGDTNGKIK